MNAFSSVATTTPSRRKCRDSFRRCERLCCSVLLYFPLAFVYGLTTWSAFVEARIGMQSSKSRWFGPATSVLGIILYLLSNTCYTVAVFTAPGSPSTGPLKNNHANRHEYSSLPSIETPDFVSLTVSSTGGRRFCKKCQNVKPDRTHHCSSCKQCVLKMDHHCPWLATCVGFRNYKAFLLFLIYTCLFSWLCFAVSATWVWTEILDQTQYIESFVPVSNILLALISGIIGLVLSAFTIWHITLAARGLTTIECLEKTRYLAPIRRSFDRYRQEGVSPAPGQMDHSHGHQFLDAHSNAPPGVIRADEGEEVPSRRSDDPEQGQTYGNLNQPLSPAQRSLYHSYEELENARERARYDEYLDEQDEENLPHAFDLGWRRNLRHLFGENPLFWALPVCNTTGDGWHWETSSNWLEIKQRIETRRIQRLNHYQSQHQRPATVPPPPQYENWPSSTHTISTNHSNVSRRLGNGDPFSDGTTNTQRPGTGLSMKTLHSISPHPRSGEVVSENESTPDKQQGGRNVPGRSTSEDEWRHWD
ncbi:hypothetical protein PABG_02636 [Paracoccidioides brasiliensis Pb03]|nr:hypothetical protein PABG_02636 [Paracoccidioides brasiliensis Pb03]